MRVHHMIWLSFDGNCREAMEFYAKAFKTEAGGILTYGDTPPDAKNPVSESDKDRVAISDMRIGGVKIHFGDRLSSGSPFIVGNNISHQLFIEGIEEATRVFHALKEGGEVLQELHQPFYAELYGMVVDKFGIIWQVLGSTPKG
jgi:PhnB protein